MIHYGKRTPLVLRFLDMSGLKESRLVCVRLCLTERVRNLLVVAVGVNIVINTKSRRVSSFPVSEL